MNSRYIPHTPAEIEGMLSTIGVAGVADLFSSIPENARFKGELDLPSALSEIELRKAVSALADQNSAASPLLSFVGAGAYAHPAPAAVDAIVSRGEFLTAYTPYQAEVAQGTLQAIYEYQTAICALLEMEVSNASAYDGSTALAEAALMAERINGRRTLLASCGLHPEYRAVLETYLAPRNFAIVDLPLNSQGVLDAQLVRVALEANPDAAAVIVGHPNCFGLLESLPELADLAHRAGALLISATTDITVYGLLEAPGACGVDIAVAEGQGLGLPLNFGGPYLGVLAANKDHVRKMPGRLVGKTVDADGQVAYTITLATREQHIRREKATSNICTNQALCALSALVYFALMGKQGIREVAEHSLRRAHFLAAELEGAACGRLLYGGPFFHEFVLELPRPAHGVIAQLLGEGIVPGFDLGRWNRDFQNHLLINATEIHSVSDCRRLVSALKRALSEGQ